MAVCRQLGFSWGMAVRGAAELGAASDGTYWDFGPGGRSDQVMRLMTH